jgi:hypothetical protein
LAIEECLTSKQEDGQTSCVLHFHFYEECQEPEEPIGSDVCGARKAENVDLADSHGAALLPLTIQDRGVLAHDARVSRCQKRREEKRRDSLHSKRLTYVQGALCEGHNLFNGVEDSKEVRNSCLTA